MVTQDFGLTMDVKKTCIMSLIQFKEDSARRIIKGKQVHTIPIIIPIQHQTIENVEQFMYLGYCITRNVSI
jgi:ribosomal protein S4E